MKLEGYINGFLLMYGKMFDAVSASTINTARAINMKNETGSINVGKKTDLIISDITNPE